MNRLEGTVENESIVSRLRERAKWLESRSFAELHGDIEREAADMLEFLLGQFQTTSVKMDSQHSYHFRSTGWPMTHARGSSPEAAIRSAMAEVEREKVLEIR